ncbi:Hypothetical protein POVR1_LOCUS188 [uncultured virus]|nr:Hypothetical protein POVR1_LOCUS188 [uncultured virus]
MAEEFPFADLPPELQSRVLRIYPELKSTSLRLNQPIYRESLHQILHDECRKPISREEVAKYESEYSPMLRATFYFSKDNDWWRYLAVISNPSHKNFYIGLEHERWDGGTLKMGVFTYIEGKALRAKILADTSEVIEYDLMTMYYVYQERLSCMQLNPQFAKNQVIEHFEDAISSLDHEDLLVFLRTNGKILGINVKSIKRYDTAYDTGEAPEGVVQEINELEKLIRKRLEAL